MKHIKSGFTLIELMIVVAIIGVLASIAIPSYQDYTIKAKVTEGMIAASAFKTHVAEYLISTGDYPANNAALGFTSTGTEFGGKYVSTIVVSKNSSSGIVRVTYGSSSPVPTQIRDKKIDLVASQSTASSPITWTCGPSSGTTGLSRIYLPSECSTTGPSGK